MMTYDPNLLTWLIPVPPLVAFFAIILGANRSKGLSHTLAIAGVGSSWIMSWVIAFYAFGQTEFGKKVIESSVPWLPWMDTALNMGVLVDPLTAIMLFFASLCMLLIFIYSIGYHNYGKPRDSHDLPGWPAHNGVEPLYSRFFAYLSLFAFGMLVLIVADNLLLMFAGWEIMGLCSFLLIGFWYARKYDDPNKITPRQAAVKAFMTTRIADVIMLLGIAYLYYATGTLSFREIMYANEGEWLQRLATTSSFIIGLSQADLIGLLLLTGTIGKSAQFPLHVWLPDAMEGPTPVSAMIHAAAMVSAGVYAVIRVYPILSAYPHSGAHEAILLAAEGGAHPITISMGVLAALGAFTALFAATIAVAQNDVKKVLAYSTISQLGFMLAALGIGGYVAATFHLVTHAFFKALLFLGSGSIIHGMEHGQHHVQHGHGHADHHDDHGHGHDDKLPKDFDPQDMRFMGGLRSKMPITFWTFVIGGMSLAGLPLVTAGFWSKDEILLDAWKHAPIVFWTLAIAALLTAFYTTRSLLMTFSGKPRSAAAEHASESSGPMVMPLIILSFFAITAGWSNIPDDFPVFGPLVAALGGEPFWFKSFLGGTLVDKPEALAFDWFVVGTSFVVALGGIALGWWVYRKAWATHDATDPVESALAPIYPALKNKYWFDELYHTLFVRPTFWLARDFFPAIDRNVIDGVLHGVAWISLRIGDAFRDYFDRPVVNGASDGSGVVVKAFGGWLRVIQTGRIQQYLIMTAALAAVIAAYLVYASVR